MVENPKNYIFYLREINFGLARITISLLFLELWMKSGRNINRDVYLHFTLNQTLYDHKR